MLEKQLVKTNQDIVQLFTILEPIWREVFTPIIGIDQVTYMMTNYQSIDNIKQEIASGAQYFLIRYKGENVGYTAYEETDTQIYISKLYLNNSVRGKGLSSQLFDWYDELGKGKVLHLNVNQGNEQAIKIYEHKGFKRVDERYVDIGEGYIMNDYVYEKN
ncbi:GNAT family N-acetyltransferase [Vagococcus vulneris]|uniref:GNAT family N-acetyltransferase n=1 Tax=Vagococcus vulneris TaxID=1977869 RepID=A0A429ZWR7_9ENTE|nr:GNAT family N-acetyltransferase [Vagococcus vulneris]RST98146.1 GNAT family N-acetyltransferase [Vagococcus vulneris]